jgi:hypothetical protein
VDLRSALAAHLRSPQVARVLYGSVVGLALVTGLQEHPPGAGVMVGTMLATAVAVGAAELYSQFIGRELQNRRLGLSRRDRREVAREVLSTMGAIAFPAVFFIFAAAGVLSVTTAFTAAQWTGLGLIVSYGFVAGRTAGASWARALLHAAALGAIGGVLILVKSLLH